MGGHFVMCITWNITGNIIRNVIFKEYVLYFLGGWGWLSMAIAICYIIQIK